MQPSFTLTRPSALTSTCRTCNSPFVINLNLPSEKGVKGLYDTGKSHIRRPRRTELCEQSSHYVNHIMINEIDWISLRQNNFRGSIPDWIGSLILLKHLDLGENEFSGELPIKIFKNLKVLGLYETLIEGLPSNLIQRIHTRMHWGSLSQLSYLDLSGNILNGTVPESIGELVLLKEFYLGWEERTNMFVGPLPSSMSNLILLEYLYLNVPTLTGPLPDFSQVTLLADCAFKPSQLCFIPEFVPVNSTCDLSVLPECGITVIPDCEILEAWLPNMFDVYFCCQVEGVTCEEDRVVLLDLSKTKTKKNIDGVIPMSIEELDKLQQLYLQDNILEGNLP
jgi:Leucine-rich repeat (LRR) protein